MPKDTAIEAIQKGAIEATPIDEDGSVETAVEDVEVQTIEEEVIVDRQATDPRAEIFAAIEKRRQAEVAADAVAQPGEDITSRMQEIIAEGMEDGANRAAGDEDVVVETEEVVQEEIVTEEITPAKVEADVDEGVEVVVDGKTQTVSEAEIREYSKQKSGDRKLEELAQREKDLDAREAALDKPPEVIEPEISVDAAGELIDAVFSEDKEATAEALKKVVTSSMVAQEPQPVGVTDAAIETALYNRDLTKARKGFFKKHPKLAGDFLGRVNTKTEEVQVANPDYSPGEVIEKAAQLVYTDVKQDLGIDLQPTKELETKIDTPAPKVTQRVVRKQKIVPLARKSISRRANIDTRDPAPQTQSGYIQEMQRQRGQR